MADFRKIVLLQSLIAFCMVTFEPVNAQNKLPDLFAFSLSIHLDRTQASPGQMLNISWSGHNNATFCIPEDPVCPEIFGSARGQWQDAVFLSLDQFISDDDILITSSAISETLDPGGSYERDFTWEIPSDLSLGRYHIIVHVDYDSENPQGQVAEQNETNNRDSAKDTLVITSKNSPPKQVLIPIQFDQGWNLISFPEVPANFDADSFFENKSVGEIWSATEEKHQHVDIIEPGKAYWVYLQEDLKKIFPIEPGEAAFRSPVVFSSGWNLFGSLGPINIPSQATGAVWHFDHHRYHAVPESDRLLAGKGYWINFGNTEGISYGSLETDTDSDGIPDYWEQLWEFNMDLPGDMEDDPDTDELINLGEYQAGTNPRHADTDSDGLADGKEVKIHKTNPHRSDTDEDGFTDKNEVDDGFDPLDPQRFPVTTIKTSPVPGEGNVAVTRETIVRFSNPLAETTIIDANSIFAEFGGEPLSVRRHISPDRKTITLFYNSPLPPSSRIRVTVNGDLLIDSRGHAVDADNDRIKGGTSFIDFDTLSLTSIEGTAVCGRVFASELKMVMDESTFVNEPLPGVTITVDGMEESLRTVTDQFGDFRLENVPGGAFFVHIDGRTVVDEGKGVRFPDMAYYPNVGKKWESVAGEEINIGEIYLPLIPASTLQPVNATEETVLTFSEDFIRENPEFTGVSITVPPGSLFHDDGNPGAFVGIAPVPPDRLPGPLPPGLNLQDVVTIQTDGATNFDRPVPACFPNLPDPETGERLPPGAPSALWSFNHDTGQFEIVGPMTVSEDGETVCTDEGVGIRAPGWHGAAFATQGSGGEPGEEGASECEKATDPSSCPSAKPGNCSDSEEEECDPTDPVYLFSGEFYEKVEDLRIKGRGFDFVWSRKYRSKIGPNTAQGNGWDFSYNIFVRENGRTIEVCDGNSRRDLFRPIPGKEDAWSRAEFFQELLRTDAGWTMTFEDRGGWHYHSFAHPTAPGKIARIVDRNGNTMRFQYDDQGRLIKIIDTLDRDIDVAYNANDFISSVTDFSGRVVKYEYYNGIEPGGNFGDLKSVTTPAVVNTPNGNDFPDGKTTVYTYSTGFEDDRLNHNLLTITDPKGQTYLTNICSSTTNDEDTNFDRVVRQIWGNPSDIIDIVYVPQAPLPTNGGAVMKTILNDRVGNVKEYFWDIRNRCVIHRDYTGRAARDSPTTELSNRPTNKLRPDDPDFFERRFEWNQDSLKKREVYPNGNITEYIYESDLDPSAPSRLRGNLREIRRLPGTHTPVGDQEVIEEKFEYDTNFGCASCGFNFVTRHVDGRGHETLSDYDENGNLIHRQHRIPSIVENFEYNAFGQMTKHILPDNGSEHRREDVYTYYTHEEDDDQEGYLKEEIIDAPNFALTTTYEYDLVGNVIRKTDPRGNDTQYIVNELDQVVREISREVTNGSGVRYERDTYYDANNNVVREDIVNINDQNVLEENTQFTTTHEYEILNNLIRRTEEVDEENIIVTEYAYDRNRNRALQRFGEATKGNQTTNVVRTLYDERDLVYQIIRAPNDPALSTTQYDYDPNRNRVRMREGIEENPRVHNYTFDSFNRVIQSVDPMGNFTSYHYDPNSNRTSVTTFGELIDIEDADKNLRLSEITYSYDELNRLIREEQEFFDTETQEPIDDGKSITVTEYSDNSQVVRTTNDNNHSTEITYDTANRQHIINDAKSNTVIYSYDANSNVISITEVEKSDLGNADQIFAATYTYDGLDRLIETVDNIGNIHSYAYDSRNNQTVTIDALGNMIRHNFDGLNRLISTTRFLTITGKGEYDNVGGASRRRFTFNRPSNFIVSITTQQTWDDTSRLISQTDDNGNTTTYTYDALNRKTMTTYADGTGYADSYDVHDNKVTMADANGNFVDYTYDLLDRLVRKDIDVGESVSNATTFEIYKYDGLSRLVHAQDNDSLVQRSYDSLSQVIKEVLNNQTTRCVYDGVGNITLCTYPGGRRIKCTYDELERKKEIVDITNDQNFNIATYFYVGPNRVAQREYGNGTRCKYEYDGIMGIDNPENDFGVKRLIRTLHTHIDDDGILDDRTYTWDPMYNKTSRSDIRVGGPQLMHTYSYDSIYRLRKTTVFNFEANQERLTNYDLDGVGNRIQVTVDEGEGVYTMDNTTPEPADFQLNQYTTTPIDEREHDLNGNLASITNVGGTSRSRSLTYNYRNQLVRHEDTDAGIISIYAYDALGRRITKQITDNGSLNTDHFYYHGWQVCEEQNNSNETKATYVYGLYIDEVLNMQRADQDYFYHTDDLYNVMAITNSEVAVVERYDYSDYGDPTFLNSQSEIINHKSQIGNPYPLPADAMIRKLSFITFGQGIYNQKLGVLRSEIRLEFGVIS